MKDQDAAGENDDNRDTTRILKTLLADMARLVIVEAKLFGHTVLAMVGLTLVIAMLLLGGWLFTGAGLVVALANLQAFSLMDALLTVALAHLVLASLACWRLRVIIRDLTFRESRASMNSLLVQARSAGDAAAGVDAAEPSPEEK